MIYTTRIAPSPTGLMHIGTARTALFNWLAARATGGRFLLRIDDTDAERNQPEAVQPIFDGLAWLGLGHDAVFRQSERTAIYQQHASLLLDAGLAKTAENGAVLLDLTADFPWPRTWNDRVKGAISVTERDFTLMQDLPLVRGGAKLGDPTYQFTSMVDDYLMDVNLIIRGKDHIANTGKQIQIWAALNRALGQDKALPEFAHVGLIFKDKKKMSKRDGAASLLDYRDHGYDPDALFNFLLRMGWGPHTDDKANSILSRAQSLALFLDHGNLRQSDAGFDQNKLDWFDRKYKAAKERR